MGKEIYATLEKMRLKFYTLVEKQGANTYILKSHSDEELYIYDNKDGTIVKGRRIDIVLDKYMPVIANGKKQEIGFIMRADSDIIKKNQMDNVIRVQEGREAIGNIAKVKKVYNEKMRDKEIPITSKIAGTYRIYKMRRKLWKEFKIIC